MTTESQDGPIRLGFIGAGAMATWQIYPSLHFAPFELVAVCDVDKVRATHASRTLGGESYTDYRQMLRHESLEAVIVQMHPKPRGQIVADCLDARLHVLVPKPPAVDTSEAIHLADLAHKRDRILMVNVVSVTASLKRSRLFDPPSSARSRRSSVHSAAAPTMTSGERATTHPLTLT